MLDKKSPNANLEDKKTVSLLLGLVFALSVVYVSLEWSKSDVVAYVPFYTSEIPMEITDVPQTAEVKPPPPPPAPVIIEKIILVDNEIETAEIPDFTTEELNEKITILPPVEVIEANADDEVPIIFAEKMPEFPGNVFEYLAKQIRYPVIAQENGIEGRVVCQFVVNRDGSIVDIVIIKSPDPSLEREARRVVESMPKWKPGEQGGKTVRVKYTLPIIFKLKK